MASRSVQSSERERKKMRVDSMNTFSHLVQARLSSIAIHLLRHRRCVHCCLFSARSFVSQHEKVLNEYKSIQCEYLHAKNQQIPLFSSATKPKCALMRSRQRKIAPKKKWKRNERSHSIRREGFFPFCERIGYYVSINVYTNALRFMRNKSMSVHKASCK